MQIVHVSPPGERGDGFIALRTPYEKKEVTKLLPRRHWSGPPERVWLVPEEDLAIVIDHYGLHGMKVMINGIDSELFQRMASKVPRLCKEDLEDRLLYIPSEVWARLLPFQERGVHFGIQRRGRMLLADEPGLGKTVEAILVAAAFCDDWPLLVICPAAMLKVWKNTLIDWLPQDLINPDNIQIIATKKDADFFNEKAKTANGLTKGTITIIGYHWMSALEFSSCSEHKAVIADESHLLRNPTAERTRNVRAVVQQANTRILISSTPIENTCIELYSQIQMVSPGLFGSRDDYGRQYCGGLKTDRHGTMDYWGETNKAELNALLRETLLLRRRKDDVMAELPDRFRCAVPLDISGPYGKELAALQVMITKLDADHTINEQTRRVKHDQLVKELTVKTGLAKVAGSIAYLTAMLEKGHKIAFFAVHDSVLDAVEIAIKRTLHQHIRINADTPPADLQRLCRSFQEDAKFRVALISIKATNASIILTAADMMLFAELDYQPTVLQQAEIKAHPVGQTKALQVHYLVAADYNSADDIMWKSLQRQLGIVGLAVDRALHGKTAAVVDTHQALEKMVGSKEGAAGPSCVKPFHEKEAPGAPSKKRQKKGGMGEAELIDLTVDSGEDSPKRTKQFSTDEQGPLASSPDEAA